MSDIETIAVAMSGGVDSSAVAALLHAEGHTIVGLTLQLWNQRRLAGHDGMPEAVQGRCCSIDDVYDARQVAGQLGIPYYMVNQQERFEADVVKPFVAEYLAGRTPIPCTLCNNHLKFDQLSAHRAADRRVADRHRPLRPQPLRPGAQPLDPLQARRPLQGPDLLPLWPHPGPTRPHPLPPRRDVQAGGARSGPRRPVSR